MIDENIRKKPYTNEDLFNLICKKLDEKQKLPNILDYYLADQWSVVPINSYEWDIINKLDYGGSEGIYLDIAIKGLFDKDLKIIPLGTFKTLNSSAEAMYQMANILADFVIEIRNFVNENINDFVFSGYDLSFIKDDKLIFGYTLDTLEKVKVKYSKEIVKGISKCNKVILINNKTKESKEIKSQDDIWF